MQISQNDLFSCCCHFWYVTLSGLAAEIRSPIEFHVAWSDVELAGGGLCSDQIARAKSQNSYMLSTNNNK